MNRDLVLEQACDRPLYRTRRRRLFDRLRELKRESDAAAAAFQSRVVAPVDCDLWSFLAHGDIPRVGWARSQLWVLFMRWPEAFVTDRGGEGRR
jgi:hypothetical protein